jgi:hypothetical protein
MDSKPFFAEHHVPHGQGRVHARDLPVLPLC